MALLAKHFPYFAAPLLLVLVAFYQIFRTQTLLSSPWKRGGFGMFSTVDSFGERGIDCKITDAAGDAKTILLELSALDEARSYDFFSSERSLRWYLNDQSIDELKREVREDKLRKFGEAILAAGEVVPLSNHEQAYISRLAPALSPKGLFKLQANPTRSTGSLQSVQLRVWRYRFLPSSRTLRWEPLGKEIEVRTP